MLFLILTVIALNEATSAVDPCTENTLMDNLHRRIPSYRTQGQERKLCDERLDEGEHYHYTLLLLKKLSSLIYLVRTTVTKSRN